MVVAGSAGPSWTGSITVLADNYQGKRLNSPNDVVVKSDGSVWFTDPTYGIDSDYEGHKAESEIGTSHVFRLDPGSGALDVAADDFCRPNGLAFSPDERILYVNDTGITHGPNHPQHIRAFQVEGGRLRDGRVFATSEWDLFDGFRLDTEDNLWTSASEGGNGYTVEGELLGRIRIPEVVANCTFGGPKRNRLFMAATSSLYAVYLNAKGVQTPWGKQRCRYMSWGRTMASITSISRRPTAASPSPSSTR
jgi:gluconolactonase